MEASEQRAKKIITGVFIKKQMIKKLRKKIRKFIDASKKIQAFMASRKHSYGIRVLQVVSKFNKELDYLIWLYMQKKARTPASKKA